jgi:predicted anti-sigma-YlaC factor YlaD
MTHQVHDNCQEILELLNAYIDGELDPLSCSRIEEHLENCADCQVVFKTLNKTIQLCQNDREAINVPPDARKRLLAALGLDDIHDKNT